MEDTPSHAALVRFWLAIVLTGLGTGVSTAALTLILQIVQHHAWPGIGVNLLGAASRASSWRHILVLLGAGLATGAGQIILVRLTSSNSIDITEAIWFSAGRLPTFRTLSSALLLRGRRRNRRLRLAGKARPSRLEPLSPTFCPIEAACPTNNAGCSSPVAPGAGIATAYGVPLGGALFALEVLRGILALRLVLPSASDLGHCDGDRMAGPAECADLFHPAHSKLPFQISLRSVLVGPVAGFVSVGFVRMVASAAIETGRVAARGDCWLPVLALGLLALISIPFPQLLGNGKDLAQLAFSDQLPFALLAVLLILKPAVTIVCLGSGVPGGLFTPPLALGALLGAVLGHVYFLFPGVQPAFVAVMGAGAVLAATTQGPISAVVLMMELTGQGRSFIVPLMLAVVIATLISRAIEPRSIYDARLTDEEIAERQKLR